MSLDSSPLQTLRALYVRASRNYRKNSRTSQAPCMSSDRLISMKRAVRSSSFYCDEGVVIWLGSTAPTQLDLVVFTFKFVKISKRLCSGGGGRKTRTKFGLLMIVRGSLSTQRLAIMQHIMALKSSDSLGDYRYFNSTLNGINSRIFLIHAWFRFQQSRA